MTKNELRSEIERLREEAEAAGINADCYEREEQKLTREADNLQSELDSLDDKEEEES